MLAKSCVPWLQRITASLSPRERRPSKGHRRYGRSPLVIEPLEDRVLLSLTFSDKLVPAASASSAAGQSVAVAGDVAVVGAPGDDSGVGAVYVFTFNNGMWTQQPKLVGSGAVGAGGGQGTFVSLSADGNTLVEGAPRDNGDVGAAYVFTRSAGTWIQQGNKLVGTGTVGNGRQGLSVSLSGDGNTLVEGAPDDNLGAGAAYVFTRSAGTWTQQGAKLVGAGAIGPGLQGSSVSLSADGDTLVEGAPRDNLGAGATYVFTRSAGTWTQQGPKLIGNGTAVTAD
jgi:hypothetical protein